MGKLFDVLQRPVLTEKSTTLKAGAGKVSVEVAVWANKNQIKTAAKQLFDVEVESVQTLVVRGKNKRMGSCVGKQRNWKKAILTLAEGADLDVFGTAAQIPVDAGNEKA